MICFQPYQKRNTFFPKTRKFIPIPANYVVSQETGRSCHCRSQLLQLQFPSYLCTASAGAVRYKTIMPKCYSTLTSFLRGDHLLHGKLLFLFFSFFLFLFFFHLNFPPYLVRFRWRFYYREGTWAPCVYHREGLLLSMLEPHDHCTIKALVIIQLPSICSKLLISRFIGMAYNFLKKILKGSDWQKSEGSRDSLMQTMPPAPLGLKGHSHCSLITPNMVR